MTIIENRKENFKKVLIIDIADNYELLYKSKFLRAKLDMKFISNLDHLFYSTNVFDYDVIFISHYLRNCLGIEICKWLRNIKYNRDIIILVPGNHIIEVSKFYEDIKISGVLNKAINTRDFIIEIDKIFNKQAIGNIN